MNPLIRLEECHTADGMWELWQRDGELSLLLDGTPVANTRSCGSEEEMSRLALSPMVRVGKPLVIIAGLGLGCGALSALNVLPRMTARFIIAEPVEQIISWCRQHCDFTSSLWQDQRVRVEHESAVDLCRARKGSVHAILLRHTHARCRLALQDAQTYFEALKGGGLLAILLAEPDTRLEGVLLRAGFDCSVSQLPAAAKGKRTLLHTLILARRGRYIPFAERKQRS